MSKKEAFKMSKELMNGEKFEQSFELKEPRQHFRYDPVMNSAISLRNFKVESKNGAVPSIVETNGKKIKTTYYFDGDDPRIELYFHEPIVAFSVTASIVEIEGE